MEEIKKPHARGKPEKPLIPDDVLAKVAKLAGMGMPQKYLAAMCDMSESTFERMRRKDPRVNEALLKAAAEANGAVIQTLWEMATSGKHPTMTIFYAKCKLRWKEETTSSDLIDLDDCDE